MKRLLLFLCTLSSVSMELPVPNKRLIPPLKALCMEHFIFDSTNTTRNEAAKEYLNAVAYQENIYQFCLSRGLTLQVIKRLKALLSRDIKPPPNYSLIAVIFDKWQNSPIKTWKSALALEPFTSLLALITEKKLSNRGEFFDALNIAMRESAQSFALATFLIKTGLNNDLSGYPYNNVVVFPLCCSSLPLELKQFLKLVLGANIALEMKNSVLRRASHQMITHSEKEYQEVVTAALENGADPTVLSASEQHALCHHDSMSFKN